VQHQAVRALDIHAADASAALALVVANETRMPRSLLPDQRPPGPNALVRLVRHLRTKCETPFGTDDSRLRNPTTAPGQGGRLHHITDTVPLNRRSIHLNSRPCA
jgi:hypothetical protein